MLKWLKSEHPSDSTVQQQAEILIIKAVEDKLNLNRDSISPKRIPLKNTYVELDGYSNEAPVLCEVYAHIGAMKGKQFDKVISDAMKMIFIEKMTGINYRKIYAVCDIEIEKQLISGSWKAMALREFGIEIVRVDIGEEMKSKIRQAQKKQYR